MLVRADAFQEIHPTEVARIDLDKGVVPVFGRGENPVRYVATDDAAALIAALAREPDPPRVVEFGGPEALTRKRVAERFEAAIGRPMKLRRLPRPLVRAGMRALDRPKPVLSSLLGLGLDLDTTPCGWDDAPLRQRGVEPRPAGEFISARSRGTR